MNAEDFVRLVKVFIRANGGQEDGGQYIFREGGEVKIYSSKDLTAIVAYQHYNQPVLFVKPDSETYVSPDCELPRLVEVLSRGLTLDLLSDAAG